MIRIVEIGEIAWQGITEPVFCRGEDGKEYIVKGKRAGRRALIAEWVANRLGHLLHLPIPPFALMELDPAIAAFSVNFEKVDHLGTGPLFGSLRIPNVVELRHSDLALVDESLRARVLAFDWWIANSDRVFIEGGGNPNLLWSEDTRELIVIDHNLAFDPSLMKKFWTEHAFRDDCSLWTEGFRNQLNSDFRTAISNLRAVWAELPDDWTEIEGELTFEGIESLLWRFERDADTFWKPT
jgi:hypothetical protein